MALPPKWRLACLGSFIDQAYLHPFHQSSGIPKSTKTGFQNAIVTLYAFTVRMSRLDDAKSISWTPPSDP